MNDQSNNTTTSGTVITIDSKSQKYAIFFGDDIKKYHKEELELLKIQNLLAPNSEYYEISTRPIIGVDDLYEIVLQFKTEVPVSLQYNDMMLNDVKTVSLMPTIGEEPAYITIMDSNELQLALLIPETNCHCLFIKNVSLEDDIMLFVEIELLDISGDKYPYFYIENKRTNGESQYLVKGRLNPNMLIPRTIVSTSDSNLIQAVSILDALKKNNELLFIPYTGFVIDDDFDCFRITNLGKEALELEMLFGSENEIVPYAEYANINSSHMYRYYIDKATPVVHVSRSENNTFRYNVLSTGIKYDGDLTEKILNSIQKYYPGMHNSSTAWATINAFLEDAGLDTCLLIDYINDCVITMNAGADNHFKLV